MKNKIKLGMPHLTYHGIDPIWLLKTLGDNHWNLLKHINPFNRDDQRLYASFFAAELDFNKGQDCFKENEDISIESKIFKFNNLIYRSIHTVKTSENNVSVVLDTIFVKKDITTGTLIKDEPEKPTTVISSVNSTFLEENRRIKRELCQLSLESFNELIFNPEIHFNGVKLLYCANYLNLAMLNEWITFKKILNPIKKINIYWFKNIEVNDKVYGLTTQKNNEFETILSANKKPISFIKITR